MRPPPRRGSTPGDSPRQVLPLWKKALVGLTLIATIPWAFYCVKRLVPSVYPDAGFWRMAMYVLTPPAVLLLFLLTGKKNDAEPVRARRVAPPSRQSTASSPSTPSSQTPTRPRPAPAASNGQAGAQAPSTDMNSWARMYLEPKRARSPYPPDHFAYSLLLDDPRLDFSIASLDRVDALLDYIRKRDKPAFDAFVDNQRNQNFLLVLCFYVGDVMAKNSGQNITWLDYDTMLRTIPGNGAMFPRCFQTLATCILDRKGFFAPLSSICTRLFEEEPGKSVRFSAETFM